VLTARVIHLILALLLAACSAAAQTQAPNTKPEAGSVVTTGSITGRVTDENGQPLPNATVFVRAAGAQQRAQMVATDREGAFRFSGLDNLPYTLSVSTPAYVSPPREPSGATSPAKTYRIGDTANFTLIRGGAVTGAVVNANGEPLVGISVRVQMVRDTDGRIIRTGYRNEAATDDRGIYRVYGLPTGTYVVMAGGSPLNSYSENFNAFQADAPTYAPSATREGAAEISVRTGEEVTGIDIRYRGEQARVVSGRVLMPETADGRNQVFLNTADEKGIPWNSAVYQQPGTPAFTFTGVPDGDYYVYAAAYLGKDGVAYSDAKPVKVKGADVTGIELSTRPLGSVSGRLALEESKAPECAEKKAPVFSEISVAAWHKDDEAAKQVPQFFWSLGAPVYPDAEGNFKLSNLATGQYHFIPRYVSRYWYIHSITLTPATKTTKPIDAARVWTAIKNGDRLAGLTITLAQGAASLHGQIVVGEGEQLPPKQWVYLVPAERERAEDVLRFYGSAVSPDGRITVGNIAPGRYWVVMRTETEEGAAPLTKVRLPDENETRAKLRREAEAAKTELELKPCQTVSDFKLSLKP
jgi:hypothetical protein